MKNPKSVSTSTLSAESWGNLPTTLTGSFINLFKAVFLGLLIILSLESTAQNATLDYTVKGTVRSAEDGEFLPGVNIMLKDSRTGIATDGEGKFEFPQKLKEGDVLIFSYVGLEKQEYVVSNKGNESLEIKMVIDPLLFTGALAVNEVYSPAPSGFKKLFSKVKNVF